jgi:hypothetical protein
MTDHLTHLLIHVNKRLHNFRLYIFTSLYYLKVYYKRLHNFRLYIFTSLYYLKVYYKINCVDFNKVLKFNFILEITQA